MNQALGMIETVGKVAAITAMDAAVKTADITLISLENSRGQGRMCAKFVGEVSAVKSAVEAGIEAVSDIGCEVYAYKVIARPSEELDELFKATMGQSHLESWHMNQNVKEEKDMDDKMVPDKEVSPKKKVNTQIKKTSKKNNREEEK